MDVIVIESQAYKDIVGMFETTLNTVTKLAEENKKLKDDRWMSLKEVMKYLGFGKEWVLARKSELGYFQVGCKDLKFRKSKIDLYMEKHFKQNKTK